MDGITSPQLENASSLLRSALAGQTATKGTPGNPQDRGLPPVSLPTGGNAVEFSISEAGRAIADESDAPFREDSAGNQAASNPDASLPPALRHSEDSSAEPPPLPGSGGGEAAPPPIGLSGGGEKTPAFAGIGFSAQSEGPPPPPDAGLPPGLQGDQSIGSDMGTMKAEEGLPPALRAPTDSENEVHVSETGKMVPGALGSKPEDTEKSEKSHEPTADKVIVDEANNEPSALERMQTIQQKQVVASMERKDRAVRAEEYAKAARLGQHGRGSPRFKFETGPNGHRYATEGQLAVNTREGSTPEVSIRKARAIKSASLTVGKVTTTDRKMAAQALLLEMQARSKIVKENLSTGSTSDELPPIGMRDNDDVSLAVQAKKEFVANSTLKPGEFGKSNNKSGITDDDGKLKNPILENDSNGHQEKIEQTQFESSFFETNSDKEEQNKGKSVLDLFA